MLLAGALGIAASLVLTLFDATLFAVPVAALMLFLCNLNFAMPDVMIDATVAERAKLRPDLAAEMQALCWGSLGAIGMFGTSLGRSDVDPLVWRVWHA